MAKQVSSTYGDALFELALENDSMDSMLEELCGLCEVLKENKEFIQLLMHPEVVKEEKLALVQRVFSGRASDAIVGMLCIVVKNDRSSELMDICEYVIHRIKDYKKIGTAKVQSAVELTQEQKASIQKRLIETTAYEDMEIGYTVDPSLIGGVVIRVGDRIMDSSIKGQLERMSAALANK